MAESPLATWLRGQGPTDDTPQDARETTAPQPFPWGADEEPTSPFRRRALLLLAGLPWIAAAVLGAVLLARGGQAPSAASATPEAPVPEARVPEVEGPRPVDRAALGEAGALMVRALLDPALPVEAATVTAVEPVGEAWVVTVLALVAGANGAGVERYAVALDDAASGPVALSGPWPLPPPTAAPPTTVPVTLDDPALRERATAALASAGYADVTALELAQDPALPGVLLARVSAAAPRPGTWTVWLTEGPDPRVVGAS